MQRHTYSDVGLALTQEFEGLRLASYQDSVGVWTIGYGHTGADVWPNLVWTKEQADAMLKADVLFASNCVNTIVKLELNQNQFDALVDFVFNVGIGNFAKSTMLRLLNAGNISDASKEFANWNKNKLSGLARRRIAETDLFNSAP